MEVHVWNIWIVVGADGKCMQHVHYKLPCYAVFEYTARIIEPRGRLP